MATNQRKTPRKRCGAVALGGSGGISVLAVAALLASHGEVAGQSSKGGASGFAQREIAKREARVKDAQLYIEEAGMFYSQGNYQEALTLYKQAYDALPDAPMAVALRENAKDGYSRAATQRARELAAEGHYPEARALLQSVLAPGYNPNFEDALKLQKELEDPDRYEVANSPEHVANVKKVQDGLTKANSYFNLGDYDKARVQFEDVLRVDKYNSAARSGLERVAQKRITYFGVARDQMRGSMLNDVNESWEEKPPLHSDVTSLFGAGGEISGGPALSQRDSNLMKMRTLIIPTVSLQGATLEEVVEFLRIRSREADPQKKGVDFVLRVPEEFRNKPVNLSLSQVPLEEVVRYATESTGTIYRVEEFAVTINGLADNSTAMVSRTFPVPPGFIQNSASSGGNPTPGVVDPFSQGPAGGASQLVRRMGAKEFLEGRGVIFPEGSSASYNTVTGKLMVRNTVENMAMVEAMVDQASMSTPRQVEIQVRMLEINETRLGELGFDWLLGQFNVPGSDRIFASGGNIGNQRAGNFTSEDFPFSVSGVPVGGNPITSGLRSSGAISSKPSIDALLGTAKITSADSRSPGVLALSGVFTDPQFQTVLRGLDQKKGVNMMACPSVIAKSGEKASVTISRELIYPTEFEPPQIPQNVGSFDNASAPILPATPSAFDMRDVGVLLEVEPVISDDNRTVELNLVPSTTEFEGFVNYGGDISGAYTNPVTGGVTAYDIPNMILQPVFRTSKINTNVTVWDGQTVVLGGLKSERVTDIDDKVPVIGSIPIVGRAFKSKVRQSEKKNVLFFVTVRVVDPAGNRVAPR